MKTIELLSGIYLATWFLIFVATIYFNPKEFKDNSFVALIAAIFSATVQSVIVFVPMAAGVLIWRGL